MISSCQKRQKPITANAQKKFLRCEPGENVIYRGLQADRLNQSPIADDKYWSMAVHHFTWPIDNSSVVQRQDGTSSQIIL